MATSARTATDLHERLATNPAFGVARTLWLLATRRIHFGRDEVGRTLTTDDGARYRVFRRVAVDSGKPPARTLFIVRFTPAHMTVRQNIRFSRLPMLAILGFRGFRSKYWCVDDESGACQGVYEWQTVADAEAYARSIALRFMTNRSIPDSVGYRILERNPNEPWPIELSAGASVAERGTPRRAGGG